MSTFDHHRACQHKMYRMTCEDFDGLWAYADGCCHICRTPEPETKRGQLVIDHARDYGWYAVRGLLCDKCNAHMRRIDSGERYDKAADTYRYNAWFIRVLMEREAARRLAAR